MFDAARNSEKKLHNHIQNTSTFKASPRDVNVSTMSIQ